MVLVLAYFYVEFNTDPKTLLIIVLLSEGAKIVYYAIMLRK